MKQKKVFGFLMVTALIAIILLGSSPTSAAPFTQSATQTRTATATTVITPTNTTVPPAAPTVVTPTKTTVPPTATTVVTPTKTSTPVPATATLPKPTATQVVTPTTVKPMATVTPTAVVSPTATVTKTVTVTATKTATPTATNAAPTATPTKPNVLAPRAGTVAVLSTMFAVQNIDSTAATVTATFYDTSGSSPVGSGATCSNLQPKRSCIVDQRISGGGLPDGTTNWQGSVVLGSNTQLATVVNELAGSAGTLGTDFRADSYNGTPSSQADTTALLPQIMKNIFDTAQQKTYNSTIAIQNTNAGVSAHVTVTYTNIYTTPAGVNSVHGGITIPANASIFLDMANEVAQWSQFFGPAYVTSDQNIAVVVNHNAAGSLLVYRGFTRTGGGNSIIVTQGMTNIFDQGQQLNYGSAVEGMTVDGSSVAVTVQYTNLLGGTSTCTLPVGRTFRVDLRYQYRSEQPCKPPLAGGNTFFGSMTFTASTAIVALSNIQSDYVGTRGIRASTSRAFVASAPGGAMTAFAPILMNNYYDAGTGAYWGTALEGRFLSGTGTATITYYDIDSASTWGDTYTAGADQIFRWDQRESNPQTHFSLPSGKRVSAVITAPNPFVFTVNNQATSATLGDALTAYMSK